MTKALPLGLLLSLGLIGACSAGSDGGQNAPIGGGAAPGGGGGGVAGGTGVGGGIGAVSGSGGDGIIVGGGGSVGGGPTSPDGSCASVADEAEKALGGKADIIWVIDNSGSMFDEAQAVQTNLANFSGFITGTGIDVRVVAVSSGPSPLPPFVPPHGICIPPPLGSGQPCPNDSNPPPAGNYLHVIQEVDSHNALQQLMGTYPQWQGMLRADATKTFVVVTDDEGNPVPTVDEFAAFFDQAFAGSLWRFSGIYCVPGGIGGLNCSGTGAVYDTLVRRTGGVASDMSQPDWGTVFQQLGDAVIADARPVDCEWIIPPAPEGQAFAKDAVNVQFTGTAGLQKLYFAPGGAAGCSDQFLGWHYDNDQAPTKVVACPGTCPVLQADLSAKVEVLFGCPTEEPPIR